MLWSTLEVVEMGQEGKREESSVEYDLMSKGQS